MTWINNGSVTGLAFEQKDGGTPVGDVSITISVEPNQLSDGETLNIVTKATFQDSQDSPLKIVAPAGTMAASVIQYQVATSRDARSDFVIQTLEANNMWQPAATLGVSIQQNSLWVYVTADDAGKSIRIIEKEHM